MCPLARAVGAERLDMELDVRRLKLGAGFQKRGAKACCHRHRSGPPQRIFKGNADILQRVACLFIDCAFCRLVNRARLKMVLKVLANTGKVMNHVDAMR